MIVYEIKRIYTYILYTQHKDGLHHYLHHQPQTNWKKNTIAAVPDMFSLDGMAVGHLSWKIGAIPTGTMTFVGLAKLATFHFWILNWLVVSTHLKNII